jgi:hypothetical protein
VTFPYVPVFLGVLLVYMFYSEWIGLDSRYLVAGALVLLVVTAIVDAAGATGAANTLAEFVFFLLAGGVVLLLVDHVRERPREREEDVGGSGPGPGHPDAPDASQEWQGMPDESLDSPEQETVALVDAPGQ